MVTKADKKNAIRQGIIDSAGIYSQSLAGKTFLYVYGEEFFEVSFPIDHFLHLTGVETKLSAKDFYKNAKKAKETARQIPLERILLETDCPYMAPVPNRGKRNSSLYLQEVVKTIAEIKGISCEEVVAVTESNAVKMLGMM